MTLLAESLSTNEIVFGWTSSLNTTLGLIVIGTVVAPDAGVVVATMGGVESLA